MNSTGCDALLWTLDEVGKRLGGVSKSSVRRLIDRGELASCRVGLRLLRVPAESVRMYIERIAIREFREVQESRQGVSEDVAARPQEADNLTRAESVACKEIKPCHTDGRIRRIGGSNTLTQAANQLTNLLEQLTRKRLKHSKQNGGLKSISKRSGGSSPNTLSTS
ncbi:MAG: DNA-binding protein [Rhodocyclaceae bacterium]|nr:MAG: DNA-binding protein [Rhodocyclaceae bacterium]